MRLSQLVLSAAAIVCAAGAGIAANNTAPAAASSTVKGQAVYREEFAVPPGAQFEVAIEDVSRADTPAEVIASVTLSNIGNPPYTFAIPYNRARIVAENRYAVRARLTHEGRLLLLTDQSYPVITRGNPVEVRLLLKPAAASQVAMPPAPAGQTRVQSLGVLPATFNGDLPCADCSAIQYRLDLFADNTYDLLMIHRGKSGNSVSQSGRWERSDANSIALLGGRSPLQFAITGTNSLRLLDQHGGPIDSSLNYTLTRDTQTPDTELVNTAWRLTLLYDQPVRRFPNQSEPQIVLRSNGTVAGSDGCNRVTGGYRSAGTGLTFSQIAATRMACINGMEQAGRFTAALGTVVRYHVTGRHLELFDSSGTLLLRFEAVLVR